MKTITRWLCGSGFALAAILALPLSTLADEHENDATANDAEVVEVAEEQTEEQTEERKAQRKLSIFELEHRRPVEIQQILTMRTAAARHRLGFRPTPADQEDLSLATDNERNLLFARGTQDQVQKVEELVEAYDRPAAELEKHQFDDVHILPVDEEAAQNVQTILTQLQYSHQTLQMGDVRLLVFRGDDAEEQVREIEEILAKLAAEAEAAEAEAAEEAADEEAADEVEAGAAEEQTED